mgnify:FL=1
MIRLKEAISDSGFSCSEKQIKQFEDYMSGILEWNEKVNLTRITDRDEFIVKHFIFSV